MSLGDCIIWHGPRDPDGYGRVRTADGRTEGAHRRAYRERYGDLPRNMLVCHRCDNPSCVNPAHLFLGTHTDNHGDRNRKGRTAKGERAGLAKLSNAAVVRMREMHASEGASYVSLARLFGVTDVSVRSIILRNTWKHV